MKKNVQTFGGLSFLEAIALKALASKPELTGNEQSILNDLQERRNYYLRNLYFTYSIFVLPIPNFK